MKIWIPQGRPSGRIGWNSGHESKLLSSGRIFSSWGSLGSILRLFLNDLNQAYSDELKAIPLLKIGYSWTLLYKCNMLTAIFRLVFDWITRVWSWHKDYHTQLSYAATFINSCNFLISFSFMHIKRSFNIIRYVKWFICIIHQ